MRKSSRLLPAGCPNWFLIVLLVGFYWLIPTRLRGAEGIRVVDLTVSSLVYDAFSQKLYGGATNGLLQIDPESGAVQAVFPVGTNVTMLAAAAGNGIWLAAHGPTGVAIRRFNLETKTAEEAIGPLGEVVDLAGSEIDPQTVALIEGSGLFTTALVIRDGTILPDSRFEAGLVSVALQGNFIFMGTRGGLLRRLLGANGITENGAAGVYVFGDKLEVFKPYIYRSFGSVLNFDDLSPRANLPTFLSGGDGRKIAISRETSSVYFLGWRDGTNGLLTRFDHPSLQNSGAAVLPGAPPSHTASLVTWGTHRAAFNTDTKLYLLDTDALFLPADLAVTQNAPESTALTSIANFEVTITNNGPGTAVQITGTDLSTGVAWLPSAPAVLYRNNPVRFDWNILDPGASFTFSVAVQPARLGLLTNSVAVSQANDPDLANNTSVATSPVIAPRGPVTVFNFAPALLTYDSQRKRLFFEENNRLWSLDPETLTINGPQAFPDDTFEVRSLDAAGGAVYGFRRRVNGGGDVVKIAPDTLAISPIFISGLAGRGSYDLAVSPVNSNILFLSDDSFSAIAQSYVLPGLVRYSMHGEFSPDGSKLYGVDPATCELQTFQVTENGLTSIKTNTTGTCSSFKQAGGLLYFGSGLIFDPVDGEKATNSLNLPAGAIVVPRDNGIVDVLARTNGMWELRRLAASDRHEIRRVSLEVSAAPIEAIGAGENYVAFRTSGSGLFLVDLTSGSLVGRISLETNGTAVLQFDTVAGELYQVERSEMIREGWLDFGQSFTATGSIFEEAIPLDQPRTAFFRLRHL